MTIEICNIHSLAFNLLFNYFHSSLIVSLNLIILMVKENFYLRNLALLKDIAYLNQKKEKKKTPRILQR